MTDNVKIKVALPQHLRTLAKVDDEIEVEVAKPVTIRVIIQAVEAKFPVLRGTIREYGTLNRRPWLRFFACGQDLSHDPVETEVPQAVADGEETFIILGAIAGG